MRENVTATIIGNTAGGMKRNYIINRNRVDNKGRALRTNEFQDKDGRYKYRYYGSKGTLENVYSWRLLPTDEVPVGKRYCESLREKEEIIFANLENIRQVRENNTLDNKFHISIENRNLSERTKTNYIYMYEKFVSPELGRYNIQVINTEMVKKFVWSLMDDVGFCPRTVEIVCNILRPVFREAINHGIIMVNPVEGIMIEVRKDSRWIKRDYPTKKGLEHPYVYRYIDKRDNKTKYVGIVYRGNFKDRIARHKKDLWNGDSEWKIQYFQVVNRSEAEAIESHLIALYETHKYYNVAKSNWGINSYLPSFEDRWIDYAE